MCGIFGVWSTDSELLDIPRVTQARESMVHRGPDDYGLFISRNKEVVFAHRRLSIIDLTPAGHQPMQTRDGRYTIVYNGEIYNFQALKQELQRKGYVFGSESDTEVLLNGYAEKGPACLADLRGMFAFAVWDEQNKGLFAARDRFGIKPFYYWFKPEVGLIFASELKAIKTMKPELSISPAAIDQFLRTGSIPAPLTIYEGVHALPPGHFLRVQRKPNGSFHLEVKRWWCFADLLQSERSFEGGKQMDRDQMNQWVRQALVDSIRAHRVADVEVGAFLSGGIDSTAVVSLMRQAGQEQIKTVSIVFPNHPLDEGQYARMAARQYRTDHVEVPVTEKDLHNYLPYVFQSMDQPTVDGVNTYFVSQAAREAGLKVVLSGLGGDELFGGYPSFRIVPRLQLLDALPLSGAGKKVLSMMLGSRLPTKASAYLKNGREPHAAYQMVRGLFTDEELRCMGWTYENDSIQERDECRPEKLTPLQYVSCMESTRYMRHQLLRDSDIFSMAHSLELRVPFVDHELYAAVLPFLEKGYRRRIPKKMLVDAVGDIPEQIIQRSKMGFTFPFRDWIQQPSIETEIQDGLQQLNQKLNMDARRLKLNNLHWSRTWALFVLSKYV